MSGLKDIMQKDNKPEHQKASLDPRDIMEGKEDIAKPSTGKALSVYICVLNLHIA